MFDLFMRAPMGRLFRTRSANRDAETDYSRIEPVFRSIEDALRAAEAEHVGLSERVQNVLARASISLGNGTDEYLTRDPIDTGFQNAFDREIKTGQLRLEQLSYQIRNFRALNAALKTRFPDFERLPK
jgi:hypothetical protein